MSETLRVALAEQERELSKLDAELAKFRDIQRRRDTVHTLVQQMRFALNLPPYESPVADKTAEPPAENGIKLPPIWQGAQQLIERHGPMSLGELANSLRSLGHKTLDGRVGKETMRSILGRKKQIFRRLTDGRYALLEQ